MEKERKRLSGVGKQKEKVNQESGGTKIEKVEREVA